MVCPHMRMPVIFSGGSVRLQKQGGAGQIFLVHGEDKGLAAMAKLTEDCSDLPPVIPKFGESFEV